MEIEEVKRKVAAILRAELSGRGFSVFFFGSRIAGINHPTSDLDVGIEGAGSVPSDILRSIKQRAEALPTLYTIDIVDFSLLTEEFKGVAKSHIEKINL